MKNILHMISGPRNLSTAIMYAFDNRKDTLGVDEPFYAYYLKTNPNISHPGRNEIINSQSTNTQEVINQLWHNAEKNSYLFIKNMAHHLEGVNLSWMDKVKNIFLIRQPEKLINSFSKVIDKPTLKDIGLKDEFDLYQYLRSEGKTPLVLDSGDLLKDPKSILTKLCDALEIPFSNAMLSWSSGPRSIDGVWAPHWYANVHKSTGFTRQKTSNEKMKEKYQDLLDEALPYYLALYKEAIK